jgi:hypothetical protein
VNITSVGSTLQSSLLNADGPTSGAVMTKVLDQEKVNGQDAVDLIDSAEPKSDSSVSVYA